MTQSSSAAASADCIIDGLPVADAGAAGVPTIDLALDEARIADSLAAACREWGLFLVTGHGIDPALYRRCLGEARRFFARPRADKRALSRSLANPWGYYDRELTKNARDKKEVFDIGPAEALGADPFGGTTPWPHDEPGFAPAMRALMAECEAVADRLVRIIVAGLGAPAAVVGEAFRPAATSFLRLNFYPIEDPLADLAGGDVGRAVHHHTDAGALTVLFEDGTPGLQVLRDGCWHDVAPVAGALIVNIGDMLQVCRTTSTAPRSTASWR